MALKKRQLRHFECEAHPPETPLNKTFRISNPYFYPLYSRPNILDTFQDLEELGNAINHCWQDLKQNLAKGEQVAMKELKKYKDVIIHQADKRGGGAVVLLNAGPYKKLNENILQDTDTYRPLANHPTKIFQDQF